MAEALEVRCVFGETGEPERARVRVVFRPTAHHPHQQDDIFQWFFAVRGVAGSDFDGGIYIGRVVLPPEYPLRPPHFLLVTPSGRFETHTKICLSISQFHEADGLWSPSWSIRTALTALIPFMVTPGGGAVGALDWPPDDKRALASASAAAPPAGGLGPDRQAVIDRLHAKLKARMAAAAAAEEEEEEEEEGDAAAAATAADAAVAPAAAVAPPPPPPPAEADGLRQRTAAAPAPAPPSPVAPAPAPPSPAAVRPRAAAGEWEDALLTVAATLLVLVIASVLARSVLRALGATAVRSV